MRGRQAHEQRQKSASIRSLKTRIHPKSWVISVFMMLCTVTKLKDLPAFLCQVGVASCPGWFHDCPRLCNAPRCPWNRLGYAWFLHDARELEVIFVKVPTLLGGGFKYFSCLLLPGEDFQFDEYFSDGLTPPTRLAKWV